MSASQDFVALDWIKGEIATILQQAQTALESVAEDASDASSMRACLTALHQVHGTLRMVELQGPTQVAEEMESLAQALMNQAVDDVERAQEILMQAILQVPALLDRIQREQSDNPALLLPIINNLRTIRGEEAIESEDGPGEGGDRFAILSGVEADVSANFEQLNGVANAVKLRQRYRRALQQILKKVKTRDNLTLLGKVFQTLGKLCGGSAMGFLGQGGVALVEGVAGGALRFDNRVVGWLRDVNRSLAELGARGVDALAHGVEVRQIETLLNLFEESAKASPRMERFSALFPLPAPAEPEPGLGADPDAVAAVVTVLLEELRGVTEKLDLFVRSEQKDLGELAALVPVLEQMSGTLLVVGMSDHRAVVESQIASLRGIEAAGIAPDDEQLIQIAGAFLQITAELTPLAGESEDGEGDSFADLDEAQAAVVREIRNGLAQCKDAVIEFISSNWDRSRLEEVPGTLTNLGGSLIIVDQLRCGDVLSACAGYCQRRLLDQPEVTPELDEMDDLADAITSIDYYFERLLENASDPYVQMIDVAEASVARLIEAESQADEAVDSAEAGAVDADLPAMQSTEPTVVEVESGAGSVELEGAAVEADAAAVDDVATVESETAATAELEQPAENELPEAPEVAAAQPDGTNSQETEAPGEAEAETFTADTSEPAEAATIEAAAPAAETDTVLISPAILDQADTASELAAGTIEPAETEVSVDSDAAEVSENVVTDDLLIDDEILEIFVDEANEVMESLQETFPAWRDTQDAEALADVRRAFHTLKGSGRMVGAEVVGELAWSVENMLNGIIEGTVDVTPAMYQLIDDTLQRIPGGVDDFKANNQSATVVDDLIARAEAFASGDAGADMVTAPPDVDAALDAARLDVEANVAGEDVLSLSVEDGSELAPDLPADGLPLEDAALEDAVLEDATLEDVALEEVTLDDVAFEDAASDVAVEDADLEEATLDGATLDGAALDGAALDGAALDGAALDGAALDGAALEGAVLEDAALEDVALEEVTLDDVAFEDVASDVAVEDADLEDAAVEDVALEDLALEEVTPDDVAFEDAASDVAVEDADLEDATLDGAALDGAALDGAVLEDAALEDVALEEVTLDDVAFEDSALPDVADNDVDLEGAALEGAALEGAALEDAALEGAALEGAALEGAALEGAALEGAALEGAALEDLALEEVTLDNVAVEDAGLQDDFLQEAALADDNATPGEVGQEDAALDDIALDDIALDEVALEEVAQQDAALEDLTLDDDSLEDAAPEEVALEEAAFESFALDEIALEDVGVEGVAVEEAGLEDAALEEEIVGDLSYSAADVDVAPELLEESSAEPRVPTELIDEPAAGPDEPAPDAGDVATVTLTSEVAAASAVDADFAESEADAPVDEPWTESAPVDNASGDDPATQMSVAPAFVRAADLEDVSPGEADLSLGISAEPGAEMAADDHELGFADPDADDVVTIDARLEEADSRERDLDDLSLEDSGLADSGLADSGLADLSLEESGLEESGLEESGLEESGLEESGLEESGLEDDSLEDDSLEDFGLEDPGSEDPGLADPGSEDPGLADPGLEDPGLADPRVDASLDLLDSGLAPIDVGVGNAQAEDGDSTDVEWAVDDVDETGTAESGLTTDNEVSDTVSVSAPDSLVDTDTDTDTDVPVAAPEQNLDAQADAGDDAGFGDFELEDIADFADTIGPADTVEPVVESAAVDDAAGEEADFDNVADVAAEADAPFQALDLSTALDDDDLGPMALDAIEIETVDEAEEEDLLTIFSAEAADHVETIQAWIDTPGGSPITTELIAAWHTLRGGAGMADVQAVYQVSAALEEVCVPLAQTGDVPGTPLVLATQEGLLLVQRALADLEAEPALRPSVADFVQRVQQLSDEQASPGFDLEGVTLLLQYQDVLDRWESEELDALVEELGLVSVEAAEHGIKEALALAGALLNVYEQLTVRPEGAVRTALDAGHEALVELLDQIATGQAITYDPGPVNVLQGIDLVAAQEDADRSLFITEAWDALTNVESAISKWQTDISNQQPLEAVNQQLSLLQNMAGQYEHTSLVTVTDPMIQLCEGLVSGALIANQEDAELLIAGRQDLIQQLAALREGGLPEATSGIVAALVGRLSPAPEAAETEAAAPAGAATVELPADDLDDVDEEILAIFIEEAEELVEEIDESINEWSTDTGTDNHLKILLRHLHTMKGGARLAGLSSLGEYTHDFETFLIGVQNKPVDLDEAFFALINQRQDEITRRVEIYRKLAAGEATAEDLSSLTTAPAAVPGVVAAEPAATTPTAAEVSSTDDAEAGEAAPESDAGTSDRTSAPAQEMVRVGADLLEELIILAGESSITRGRVEQQISDFTESLNEMEETINRIREQVRRLEIEAESRETLIRTQTQSEGDSAFDDLEMDRYTMLQDISRSLTEGASDMLDLKDTLVNKSRDAETLLHQQARIGADLQEGLTRTRMVPFARLIPRLRRIVRQISTEVGKSVRFDAFNVEGEIDRSVLERIVAPLEHMLRNAVDHGIESVDGRRAASKPETGRISLRLSREGGYFVLELSDDGAGIDVNRVKEKAIERGLMAPDTQLPNHDIMQFIMKAGFSTAQQLTQISGRGVGMDVVDSEIKQLGGTVSIDSTLGVGTEFVIRLPFTVSINRALMVVVKEETYAVPLNTIEGIVRVSPYELDAYYQPAAPMFEYAGQPYRLTYMGKVLERSDNPDLEGQVAPLPVILARTGDNAIAMQVDRVIGSREVVVKALGKQFSELDGVSGATVLGDGSVVIILDVMALVRGADAQEAAPAPGPETIVDSNRVRTVMIVDDSVTVRKVTSRLMERQGWDVTTAKDGVDAVNQLQDDAMPDVVLLDIEMPRMDGFEVLRTVRRDPRLAKLPIIMITSRTGEKHQQQALELGVNRFLGKPFQEANLLQTIDEVLASPGTSSEVS